MTIAVTLLTCGRVAYTRQTLASFSAQHPDARTEFILLHADDASTEPEILDLAEAHGFETVVRNRSRRGVRALRAAVVAVAAERGADWVLVLENDWEWARPFPWALFRHLVATRPDVYHLRLYGSHKDRARALRCWTVDMSRNRCPVTWARLEGAPEPAEVSFIHWGAPPAVTRIAEATQLCILPPGTGYDGSGDTHEMLASGRLNLKVARVVDNVVYHIGDESSHRRRPAARRPVVSRARVQRAHTFGGTAKPKPPLYTPAWQQTRTWTSTGSTRCLEIALATLERPASLLDVGCGDGHLVTRAKQAGVDSLGVDLSAEGAAHADLRDPLDLQRTFDWVFCWEVAEHLPAESADTLCDSLVRHLAPGGTLLFTAAHPGQRGDGHLNEQPQSYWRDKIAARGLTYDAVQTHTLAKAWLREAPKTPWYGTNLQVFTAPGARVRATAPTPRIAITMRTANRAPKPNYVGGTVRRLVEQGIDPAAIHLCVTAPGTAWLDAEIGDLAVTRHVPAATVSPNQNGLEQIRVLDPLAYDWVLLLEDDLAFCADFLGSVQRWLRVATRPDRHVYRLFTFRVRAPGSKRTVAYDWPLKNMCGTQAVLLRMEDAQAFLVWADANLETWGGFRGNPRIAFDKLMAAWALHRWPDRPGVLSHPFFVQHIGDISSLHPRAIRMDHLFAGAGWRFQSKEATA